MAYCINMRKVKVKIAVAIDSDGDWNAVGRAEQDEREVMDIASLIVYTNAALYWVEAELEVPEERIVQGKVS